MWGIEEWKQKLNHAMINWNNDENNIFYIKLHTANLLETDVHNYVAQVQVSLIWSNFNK